jgi:hypothetical protein
MYGWMWASLPPEWLDEFYSYSVFMRLSIMGRCPVNTNILAPKQCPFTAVPKHKIYIFSKTAATSMVELQRFMETISLNKAAYAVSSAK